MDPRAIFDITRPVPALWNYYILRAIATGPAIFVTLPILYFRYHTMRYRFDDEGISMSWGIIFRHQIVLNYARIQDVHLNSNAIERWLGLARIEIQTASAGGSEEMTLEGIPQYEVVRDFLYSRMRGAHHHPKPAAEPGSIEATLREVVSELRAIREHLERTRV